MLNLRDNDVGLNSMLIAFQMKVVLLARVPRLCRAWWQVQGVLHLCEDMGQRAACMEFLEANEQCKQAPNRLGEVRGVPYDEYFMPSCWV